MDFTYPTAFILALLASLAIAFASLLICRLIGLGLPEFYRRATIGLVTLLVIGVSLRWSDWREILLRWFGLMDLGIIFLFALGGAALGTLPLKATAEPSSKL